MWRRISLRLRLNLLFAALLSVWLTADVGRMLVDVGKRSEAESASVVKLTTAFVATSLAGMQDSHDPLHDLIALVGNLQNLRHVRVGLVADGDPAVASAFIAAENVKAPAWFRAIAEAPIRVVTVPAVIKQRRLGSLLIVADPSAEIDEVWSTAKAQAVAGAALTLVVLLASSLFIHWALRPLGRAGVTLGRLAAGDYAARVEPSGPPEFVDTCRQINSLAEALADLRAVNGQLLERLLDAQDEERKTIAHELHDQIGPDLFALRAKATMLAARLQKTGDSEAAAAISIRDQVETLQSHNRRILARLRPAALEELGLVEALRALVEQWRQDDPNVSLVFSASERVGELGERESLMAYRFVQEALTNAFRHSHASNIEITLSYDSSDLAVLTRENPLVGLCIRVRDDGRGGAADATPGMGILGMRERVRALGGAIAVSDAPGGGTVVEATFAPAGSFDKAGKKIPYPGIRNDVFLNN
jgi:two-component system, NarL family, sensor histidine kinase UhpB